MLVVRNGGRAPFGGLGVYALPVLTQQETGADYAYDVVQAREGPAAAAIRVYGKGNSRLWPLLAAAVHGPDADPADVGRAYANRRNYAGWVAGVELPVPTNVSWSLLRYAKAVEAGYCAAGTADSSAVCGNPAYLLPFPNPPPTPPTPPRGESRAPPAATDEPGAGKAIAVVLGLVAVGLTVAAAVAYSRRKRGGGGKRRYKKAA